VDELLLDHEEGDSELEEDDPERWAEVQIERERANRRARVERESEHIRRGEEIWAAKLEEQQTKRAANQAALARLFTLMRNLKRIDIGVWRLDMENLGFEYDVE